MDELRGKALGVRPSSPRPSPCPPGPAVVTADEINALPDHIRRYIHDLETRCDPSGDIQRIAMLTEQVRGLQLMIEDLRK